MKKTYIALSGCTSHWGDASNTLLLTDSCRIAGRDEPWKMYADPIDMTRFHGPSSVFKAQLLCNKYAMKYITVLAEALERYLKLNYDAMFYQRILAAWVIGFIQALFDRFCSIEKASSICGACFLTNAGETPQPFHTALHQSSVLGSDDIYNLFLYSDIVRVLDLPFTPHPAVKFSLNNTYIFGASGKPRFLKSFLRDTLLAYEKIFSTSTHLCYEVYGIPSLRAITHYTRRLFPMSNQIKLTLPLDVKFRSTPLPAPAKNEFEHVLSTLLPRYLPVGLCEALPHFVQWAKLQRLPHKGCLVTSIGMYNDPALLTLAGVQKRPLCIVEHGGNAMFNSCDPHLYAEQVTADRYFSTGQGLHSLPSAYISNVFQRKMLSPPLLIGNDSHRYLVRFMPVFGEGSMRPYHNWRIRFLQALRKEEYPQVRLYFREFGWGVSSTLKKTLPSLCIQDGDIPIEQAIGEAPLIILDHCLTTLFRTMATNTPTIIFTPTGGFSVEAQEVIVQLRSVGIWHDTPEKAASFYSSLVKNNAGNWVKVEKDVKDWWLSQKVQSARSIFCEKFARTSPTWANEWLCAFDELAEEWTDMRN